MRKDITIEKLMLGGKKLNKSELARRYGCCWRTIDKRLNPEKYKTSSKKRIYSSKLDSFKSIIDDEIIEELNRELITKYIDKIIVYEEDDADVILKYETEITKM